MHQQNSSRYHLVGVVFMLTGAVLFATKAIFVKLAYRYEVDSISLLALRMLFSLPFYIGIGYWQSRKKQDQTKLSSRQLLSIALVGATGYYLASYFDFLGLQYLSAGMERLILFAYPTLVLLLGWLLLNKKIKPIQWAATLITYLGMALAFSTADLSLEGNFLIGAAFVFGSALTFAIYILLSGELAPQVGSIRFTSTAMIAAAAAVLLHATIQGAVITGLEKIVYLYGLGIAIIATVIPSYLVTEGIKRIGAGDAAILGAIGPVATIILEYLVLKETLDIPQWAGAVLIISGVIIIGRNKS